MAWLRSQLPGVTVLTETGTTITPPLICVRRIPGGGTTSDNITEESLVDVDCFGADRAGMWTLGRKANAAMLNLSWQKVAGYAIDWVEVNNGLGEVPYNDPKLRRCVATYRLTARVQTTV